MCYIRSDNATIKIFHYFHYLIIQKRKVLPDYFVFKKKLSEIVLFNFEGGTRLVMSSIMKYQDKKIS